MAPSPLAADVPSVDKVPGGRRAATPYPLSENLFLLAAVRGSQYAIYLVDTLGGRELIYDDPDISCFAPIPVMPTVRPPVVPSSVADTLDEKTGRFYVQDVYQSTQPIERGSISASASPRSSASPLAPSPSSVTSTTKSSNASSAPSPSNPTAPSPSKPPPTRPSSSNSSIPAAWPS